MLYIVIYKQPLYLRIILIEVTKIWMNMKHFENIEDIDFEWVKKREQLDYHYNNEFSPNHILGKLEELFAVH